MSNDLYANTENRVDTIAGRQVWWSMLNKMHREYVLIMNNEAVYADDEEFQNYVADTYGIRMIWIDGKVAQTYDVVDADKHTLALLKFV